MNQNLSTHKQIFKPNPPTEEMVKKAQFIDKTYIWKNAGIRPGNGRSSK
jgi:hypothetical protein